MTVSVHFYSYFKDLTGCAETNLELAEGATLNVVVDALCKKFPKWSAMQKSALIAVGVEYQTRDYVLRPGDEVSLFPPVQGG
jgi:molybdopterin converting factor small subunit